MSELKEEKRAKNWEIYFLKFTKNLFENKERGKLNDIFELDYIKMRYDSWKQLKEFFELKNRMDRYGLCDIKSIYERYKALFILNNGTLSIHKTIKDFSALDPVVCETCKATHICDIFNNDIYAFKYRGYGGCFYISLCPTCQRDIIEDMIEELTIKEETDANKTTI